MNTASVTPWYLDKSFYVFILNLVLPLVAEKSGVHISADKVAALAVVSVGFIVTHGWKSAKILALELEQKALAAVEDDGQPLPPPTGPIPPVKAP